MGTERPDERAIFNEAAEIQSPEERKAYLDTTCGDDAELRTAVEELLRLHEANGRFLDVPVLASKTTRLTSTVSAGPGDLIGRYKLLQQIGEGGFGVVYMAEQVRPVRRRVALKIIKPGMDTKAVIARFEAERQALAMMEHPNIARALDAGATETGRPYFVMELVKGIPITDYCDRNHLGTKERLDLFTQVCSAVQHAHQKGIIHRDLKPSNVLVTLHDGAPVPKVIDFGIAKATDQRLTERTLFTAFGQFMGTPQYMSPEQAEMSALDVDTRSDVYSLGVLLYELLTGTTPFEGARLRAAGYDEICRIIREVEPPRPSTRISTMGDELTDVAKHRRTEPAALGKLVRGDLDWIVMKALEKDRSRRYETATGLAEDIQRHLRDEPVIAGPPGAAYRLRKFVRRNRATVMAGAVVAAALVLGLSLASVGFVRAETARKIALEAKAQAETAREAAIEAREAEGIQRLAAEQARDAETKLRLEVEEGRDVLEREGYFLRVSVAAKEIGEGNFNRARELLKGCPAEMRQWEWYWLQRLCHQDLATLKGHTGAVKCVAFSADGKHIVSGSGDATIRLWDVQNAREIRTMEGHTGSVGSVAFSPDGRRIASGSYDSLIKLWDVQSGREVAMLKGHLGEVYGVAFSPDGKRLASGGMDKTLKVWDLESGKEVFTIDHRHRPPDCSRVAMGIGHDSALHLPGPPDGPIEASATLPPLKVQRIRRRT